MQPHTRAMIAASASAFITGRKIAGVYDHATGRHLRLAAEARGTYLQGYDGERDVRFGGSLPEFTDGGIGATFWMDVQGSKAQAYDRSSDCHLTIEVSDRTIRLYDHGVAAWFFLDVQIG